MKYVLGILKFFVVDPAANILNDLFEQPLIMKVFIGWGWLAILGMITGLFTTLPTVLAAW